jgi:hypothetical protein
MRKKSIDSSITFSTKIAGKRIDFLFVGVVASGLDFPQALQVLLNTLFVHDVNVDKGVSLFLVQNPCLGKKKLNIQVDGY